MRNGFSNDILQLGKTLSLGESFRTICPKCYGGKTKEKSFNISRVPAGLVYNCFRASCSLHGIVGDMPKEMAPAKRKVKEPYKKNLVPLPGGVYVKYFAKYDLSVEDVEKQGIKFAPDIGRIYFPVYDYRGYQIGENFKAISPTQKPKTLLNRFSDSVPMLYFPLGMTINENLVLVEDQISAVKVSKVMPCAALMGTNLTYVGLSLFKILELKHLILLLDGDDAGLTASLKLQNRLSEFIRTTNIIIPTGKDPKDLTMEELRKILCD